MADDDDSTSEVSSFEPDKTAPEPPPAPPAPNKPQSNAAPVEDRDLDKEQSDLFKQQQSYEQQYAGIVQRYNDSQTEYDKRAKPLLESIAQRQAELDTQPDQTTQQQQVQRDPAIQAQIDQYRKQNPQGIPNIFGMILMGVMLSATAFGRRRGWGAEAGIMQGWGNAFKAFAQNRKEVAEEQMNNATKMTELMRLENQERNQELNNIYRNRRLNIEEKKNLFAETEKLYGIDPQNRLAKQAGLVKSQMSALHSQQQVLAALQRLKMATHNHASTFMFQSASGKAWRDQVRILSKGEVDPARSEQEMAQAQMMYPFEDFEKWYRKTPDPKTGEVPDMPALKDSAASSQFDSDMDTFLGKFYK